MSTPENSAFSHRRPYRTFKPSLVHKDGRRGSEIERKLKAELAKKLIDLDKIHGTEKSSNGDGQQHQNSSTKESCANSPSQPQDNTDVTVRHDEPTMSALLL